MPCDDTDATVVFSDCHVAVLVRSSLVPSDKLTLAVSCERAPGSVKLDVPVTVTLEMVGVTGVAGGGGAGETGVGSVGLEALLEHPAPAIAMLKAKKSAARLMQPVEQEVFRSTSAL
jgi:hypothetical protein